MALTPTVRNRVLFPDMFDPLTIKTRVTAPSETSLRMHVLLWSNG